MVKSPNQLQAQQALIGTLAQMQPGNQNFEFVFIAVTQVEQGLTAFLWEVVWLYLDEHTCKWRGPRQSAQHHF